MKSLRILLVDDHILFRKGIASLFYAREDFTVVGEADDGLQAVEKAKQTAPDLILMDVEMPNCNGLEAVKKLKAEMPEVDIVMLTVSDDQDDLFEAIKSGAKGYLLKDMEPQQLFDMLGGLIEGESPISGIMASKILKEFKQPAEDKDQTTASKTDELTNREIEVLEQVIEGSTNKEIAKELYITENTVKIHLRNILDKLHVNNRVQAAVYAVREGLVEEAENPILAKKP